MLNEPMLNERACILLKTLVERYIEDGQPVGSRTLSRWAGLNLSPASIRNIMADLEEAGYITSPHTSAGRIPTPRGYRLFVDALLTIKPLEGSQLDQIQHSLAPADPQQLINTASHLLAKLTHYAGIVLAPRRRNQKLRQIEFLSLSEKRVLLIMVTMDGEVQNRVILTKQPYTPSQLTRAANFFNRHFSGLNFEQASLRLRQELQDLKADIGKLMEAVLQTGAEVFGNAEASCVVAGEGNLLDTPDLTSDMKRLRELFNLFEQRTELLQLLQAGQRASGVQLFIGAESGIAPLDECSVITAPYEVDGEVVGTLGVIGPTRMAYERVIPIVDITAKFLSNALSCH